MQQLEFPRDEFMYKFIQHGNVVRQRRFISAREMKH